MLNTLKSPWFYVAAACVAVLLFFSTTDDDDVRLKLQVISGAPFRAVEPGMLYEVAYGSEPVAPTPLCQLQDVDSSAQLHEQHRRIFYNMIGSTLPVVPQLAHLFGDGDPPDVEIMLDYTIVALRPGFRGDVRVDCETLARRAIAQRDTTICVVDSVVRLNGEGSGLYGVRFKPYAFTPDWQEGQQPRKCGLAWYRKSLPVVRQVFIADRLT